MGADWMETVNRVLGKLDPRIFEVVERGLRAIPPVQRRIEQEYDKVTQTLEASLKPYREELPRNVALPGTGRSRENVLDEMARVRAREESRWQHGQVSGAVYHGDSSHIDFLNQVYAMHSQSNPLHADLWPSATRYEAEIVSMTARMLGSAQTSPEIVGTVTSGGTESILMAMKSYRDRARAERRIRTPEVIAPVTAHAAFLKAAHYFGIKLIHAPLTDRYQVDVDAVRRLITRSTVVLVGSAPAFPHGVIDPIEALSDLALEHELGLHVDACLGGFFLPWAERLGRKVPPFDFRLPGVTSISADTHKYGYAAKGTSVVLYRGAELRRYQYFTMTDWPGGLYSSPTMAGSRPGALSAACWATMMTLGESGYLENTRKILEAADKLKEGILKIPQLFILGDPLWIVAFGSKQLDIYRVMEQLSHKGWNLNGLHRPACVHIALTLRHTQEGVVERLLADLTEAVSYVVEHPNEAGGMAPIYGMAGNLPARGVVSELLRRYMDALYRV